MRGGVRAPRHTIPGDPVSVVAPDVQETPMRMRAALAEERARATSALAEERARHAAVLADLLSRALDAIAAPPHSAPRPARYDRQCALRRATRRQPVPERSPADPLAADADEPEETSSDGTSGSAPGSSSAASTD
jgi:hypothetical protein